MILQLKYSDEIQYETRAAFIRSAEPSVWLEQIQLWGINPLTLNCFAVPKSKNTLDIVGLFVVFSLGNTPKQLGQAFAYGGVTKNFFIPINAKLFPQITAEELADLLLFDDQIFHPSIGMVGFKKEDKISLENLLVLPEVSVEQWNVAQAVPAPFPPLQRIQIPKLLDSGILAGLKDGMETKSLKDIPGAEKDIKGESWLDKMQREALEKMLKAGNFGTNSSSRSDGGDFGGIGGLGGFFSGLGGLFGEASRSASGSGGFRAWAMKRLADLEKKRQDEIDRLMDLFDKNPAEALKYALPLDGSYLGRGAAAPSSRLSQRQTNFSLGGLGGGGRIDGWNLGNRYYELRRKYQQEAKRLLDTKHYRKAAYIYAHLLSDFSSAANALVQGKYYREAAVLYQKHLNNVPAAAKCLEDGGLFLEAIDLYIDLGKNEKVGDLYQQLAQPNQARKFYQKCIDAAQKNDDYLEVARLQRDRLQELQAARQSLLTGWQQSKQSETCLILYFEWMNGGEVTNLQQEIERIYSNHTPSYRKDSFLKVLLQVNQAQRNEDIMDTSRPIVYEIISEQIIQKSVENVHYLRQFLPDDRLIGSDCSRYVTQFHAAKKKQQLTKSLQDYQLGETTHWRTFMTRNLQFLALGTTERRLILVRGHSDGNMNYYSWELNVPNVDEVQFNLVSSLETNIVFIQSSVPLYLSEKKLAKSVRFSEDLFIRGLVGLPKDILGLEIRNKKELTALTIDKGYLKLHFYDLKLKLKNVLHTINEVVHPFSKQPVLPLAKTTRFAIHGTYLYSIHEENKALEMQIHLNANARLLCQGHSKVLVSTDKGLLLFQHQDSQLKRLGDFFAIDFSPIDIKFIAAQSFALAERNSVRIYDILLEMDRLILRETIHVERPIRAINLFAKRTHLAVLTENGRIEVFGLSQEYTI